MCVESATYEASCNRRHVRSKGILVLLHALPSGWSDRTSRFVRSLQYNHRYSQVNQVQKGYVTVHNHCQLKKKKEDGYPDLREFRPQITPTHPLPSFVLLHPTPIFSLPYYRGVSTWKPLCKQLRSALSCLMCAQSATVRLPFWRLTTSSGGSFSPIVANSCRNVRR